MDNSQSSPAVAPAPKLAGNDLAAVLSQRVVGQPAAMNAIAPYLDMYQARLAPEGRPVGIFLLLGPTGTGKTRTVEALAEVLHGGSSKILKINCGEFQMDHEVAKLIGSPPGYVGHRESQPALTSARLAAVTSPQCDLSLVLFDEIEKAAPALTRLLLGILDRAVLQLGDNTTVRFDNSMIFLTSNLGARDMMREIQPQLGFQGGTGRPPADLTARLEAIALAGVRKVFSPEFVNRIDAVITYHPLDDQSLGRILDQHIAEMQTHVNTRLGDRCFQIDVSPESRQFLLRRGASPEYGARELKRTIHRYLTQPLATLVARGEIEPGSRIRVDPSADQQRLVLSAQRAEPAVADRPPTVLLVDDNLALLGFLGRLLAQSGWRLVMAESVAQTRTALVREIPTAALLDYALPDGNGLELGLELRRFSPRTDIVIMTGGVLTAEEEMICREHGFPVLRKPFLAADVMALIRSRLSRAAAAGDPPAG